MPALSPIATLTSVIVTGMQKASAASGAAPSRPMNQVSVSWKPMLARMPASSAAACAASVRATGPSTSRPPWRGGGAGTARSAGRGAVMSGKG